MALDLEFVLRVDHRDAFHALEAAHHLNVRSQACHRLVAGADDVAQTVDRHRAQVRLVDELGSARACRVERDHPVVQAFEHRQAPHVFDHALLVRQLRAQVTNGDTGVVHSHAAQGRCRLRNAVVARQTEVRTELRHQVL